MFRKDNAYAQEEIEKKRPAGHSSCPLICPMTPYRKFDRKLQLLVRTESYLSEISGPPHPTKTQLRGAQEIHKADTYRDVLCGRELRCNLLHRPARIIRGRIGDIPPSIAEDLSDNEGEGGRFTLFGAPWGPCIALVGRFIATRRAQSSC